MQKHSSIGCASGTFTRSRRVEQYMEERAKLPTQFGDMCRESRSVAMVRTLEEWRFNGVERGALAAFIEEVGEL
jgi:hypothetical protein